MFSNNLECIVCAESIDDITRVCAIGVCNHQGVCSICFLRMRSLVQDYSCPMCKTPLDNVICVGPKQIEQGRVSYENFTVWGEDAGPDHVFDHKSRMFFPKEYYKTEVEKLRVCKCKDCGDWKRDMLGLKKHVREQHNKEICGICTEHKKVFPSEHVIYSQADYDKHLKCGDGDGSEGHPKCIFCSKRYYDKNMLFMHLEKDHFSCHICVKSGIKYKYYNKYENLENHFRNMHYICEERSCLEKRFIVFGNNIDFISHMHSWHPTLQISRAIPLSFKSYGGSGGMDDQKMSRAEDVIDNFSEGTGSSESFIGSSSLRYDAGLGGREVNGEWQVLMPEMARDPREALRRAARQSNQNAESEKSQHTFIPTEYPSLQGDVKGVANSGGSAKWRESVGGGASVRKEDYPELIGAERKAPLGQTKMANWSSRIDKKLWVKKPSSTVASSKNNSEGEASLSSAYANSLLQHVERQLRQTSAQSHHAKSSGFSNPGAVISSQSNRNKVGEKEVTVVSKQSDELTLAEKIKIEQLLEEEKKQRASRGAQPRHGSTTVVAASEKKKAPPPLPPGLGLFAPPPAPLPSSSSSTSVSSSTSASVTASNKKDDNKLSSSKSIESSSSIKKSIEAPVTKSSKNPVANSQSVVSSWGAALSADGLEVNKKSKKKVSAGLTVVKKSSKSDPDVLSSGTNSSGLGSGGDLQKVETVTASERAVARNNRNEDIPPGFLVTPPPPLPPPPGFSSNSALLKNFAVNDSDFPAFSSLESSSSTQKVDITNKSNNDKNNNKKSGQSEEKWTKVPVSKSKSSGSSSSSSDTASFSSKPFPGSWVPSLGGSGGKNKSLEESVKRPVVIDPSDFPDMSTALAASYQLSKSNNSTQSNNKTKKSNKTNFLKLS